MLGWIVGLILAAVVGLLALHRPVLARMGVGYALQRRKQTALVVAGLMVATTVLVAAGVAADSSARSFTESLLARVYLTDALATTYDESLLPSEQAEAVLQDRAFSGGLVAHASAIRVVLPAEATLTGAGDQEVAVWGIDPATFGKVARWQTAEGRPPATLGSWPEGTLVVNHLAATRFGLGVGDEATVFLAGHELSVPNSTLYPGRWELSTQAPLTEQYVHHPQDRHQFEFLAEGSVPGAQLRFTATTAAGVEVQLTVTDPNGDTHGAGPFAGEAVVLLRGDWGQGALYQVQVDSPRALQQDFTLNVTEEVRRLTGEGSLTARVAGVVETPGSDPLSSGPAVYLPLPAMQEFLSAPDRVNALLVDFRDESDLASLSGRFRESVRESWSPALVMVRTDRLSVEEERAAIEEGVGATFLGIGSFSILAGFMLIGVLMALLVEERKQVLATARALGAQRTDLTRMHAHEGALYAILAALAGLVGGAALAALAMRYVLRLFPEADVRFVLMAKPDTILSAVGWGFALVLVVIAFAAYRATRLNLVSALRGEAGEPARRIRGVVLGVVVALLGVVVTALGAIAGANWALVVGPALVAFGAIPLGSRLLGRDLGTSVPAGLLAAYLALSFRVLPIENAADALLLPVRGLLLAGCLAVVAAYSGWVHALVLRAFAFVPRTRPLFATALGHLRQRPGRAALTIAMFGTVLVVLTALGTLLATLEPNDLGDGGGFDVLADSPRSLGDPAQYLRDNPTPSGRDPLREADGWLATPWVPRGLDGFMKLTARTENGESWAVARVSFAPEVAQGVAVVTPAWAERVDLQASELAPGYPDLRAAFRAVAEDPSLVVVADGFGFAMDPVHVGDAIQAGRPWLESEPLVEARVIAKVSGSGVAGAFVHPSLGEHLAGTIGSTEPGTRVWAVAQGDPQRLAESFETAYRRAGMTATVVSDIDPENRQVLEAVQTIITLFVGLGIVIGMVSLALIMGRHVLLRRAEIGTLRALGAQPRDVLLMFSFEALYLAAWSILIGLGVGLLLAKGLVFDEVTMGLRVDWSSLAALYGVTAAGALVAAFLPAWTASRLRPARAVRYVE